MIVSSSRDNTLKLWDLKLGQELKTLSGHQDLIWTAKVSPDGQWIASSSRDSTVRVWNVETGLAVAMVKCESAIRSLCFAEEGNSLVAGDAAGNIWLFDVRTLY